MWHAGSELYLSILLATARSGTASPASLTANSTYAFASAQVHRVKKSSVAKRIECQLRAAVRVSFSHESTSRAAPLKQQARSSIWTLGLSATSKYTAHRRPVFRDTLIPHNQVYITHLQVQVYITRLQVQVYIMHLQVHQFQHHSSQTVFYQSKT
jgi:hypothetical protein